MGIIIDTGLVIAGERGVFDLPGWLAFHGEHDLAIAAVTVAELWHGLERASPAHKVTRQRYLETFLTSVVVFPYTQRTAYGHGRIWAELKAAGKIIGSLDLIIAATALEVGYAVATFNKKHFLQVPGLTVIEPELFER
jgi:tRNA(fMet)-specific endonuclease VapC